MRERERERERMKNNKRKGVDSMFLLSMGFIVDHLILYISLDTCTLMSSMLIFSLLGYKQERNAYSHFIQDKECLQT